MLGRMIWGPLGVREVGTESGKNRARALPRWLTAFKARRSVGHRGKRHAAILFAPSQLLSS